MRIIEGQGLDASGSLRSLRLSLDGDRLAAVNTAEPATASEMIIMPALVNAHDHARPIRNSSLGGFAKPLEIWLHRLALLVPVDPYLANVAALGRQALGGQGATMLHAVRLMGRTDVVTEAQQVARAAKDIGMRIAFGLGMRDQNPLVYGAHDAILASLPLSARQEIERRFCGPMLPIAQQLANVEAVASAIQGPLVDVQYAPNGPQWVSEPFWRAIAEASALSGRRVTTHLFETQYQREWADHAYPQGLVRHWKEIGLLSPRLTLAHATYARPDELELIAEAGCTISVNTSSNLALRSGLAPLSAMLKAGCKIAYGIDGQAFDEDDDALREIRLLWSLHGGWGFNEVISPRQCLAIALENGRGALSSPMGGRLEAGHAADLVVLDRAALDDDGLSDVDPLDLFFARATKRHVREVIVAGRSVVKEGKVLGVDHDAAVRELRSLYRHGMAQRQDLMGALPHLDEAITHHYRMRLGCC